MSLWAWGFGHCSLHGSLYVSHNHSDLPPPTSRPPYTQTHSLGYGLAFTEIRHVPCMWMLTCSGRLQNQLAVLAHLSETEGSERKERESRKWYWIFHLWEKFTGTNMACVHFWLHVDTGQRVLSTCALLEGLGFKGGIVQDGARVYGVLRLGPSCKVCLNITETVTLNWCP